MEEMSIVSANEGGVMPPELVVYHQQMSRTEKVKYGIASGVPVGLMLEMLGAGGFGIVGGVVTGAIMGYWSEEVRAVKNALLPQKARVMESDKKVDKIHFLLTGQVKQREAADQQQEDEIIDAEIPITESLFSVDASSDTGGIDRLTIEQIVQNCQPNSYKIFIGRSLTKPGNKAILINFYKQHFRFIGASQRGKSSMVAAFIDIVTRTHDPEHVRLVLLDKEDQTSNLFASLPHVLRMKKPDGTVKLHAQNEDQVLEYLIHCVAIMKHRYTLSKSQVLALPVILIYIEEFLALKDESRSRIDRATDKVSKDKATSDYATFVYCINLLSAQGLKARLQLLLCAQVEYADEDFREAMANIGCGFSFCVRPTAANSAGFRNNSLLQRNAEDNKIGQAVVECPDCNDLVLAPDYDLEKRLIEFETANPEIHQTVEAPGIELEANSPEMMVNRGEPLQKTDEAGVNENVKGLTFTPSQEVQVILAYEELKLSGGKLSRSNLRDSLGWTNRQWQTLKAICDKNKILMD